MEFQSEKWSEESIIPVFFNNSDTNVNIKLTGAVVTTTIKT